MSDLSGLRKTIRLPGPRVLALGLMLIGVVIAARARLVWSVAPYAGLLDLPWSWPTSASPCGCGAAMPSNPA